MKLQAALSWEGWVVYLCFDHQAQRPVALKTFKPEYLPDREARERFLREADTWLKLGYHSHIVQAYSIEYNEFDYELR